MAMEVMCLVGFGALWKSTQYSTTEMEKRALTNADRFTHYDGLGFQNSKGMNPRE